MKTTVVRLSLFIVEVLEESGEFWDQLVVAGSLKEAKSKGVAALEQQGFIQLKNIRHTQAFVKQEGVYQ